MTDLKPDRTFIMESRLEQFMRESNLIEREIDLDLSQNVMIGRLNPNDLDAAKAALDKKDQFTERWVLGLHSLVGRYLKASWIGKWRDCDVRIGNYFPPSPSDVPILMKKFVERLPKLNSWEAHNQFEAIHPFQDLNGRVGRLIWLAKVVDEGCRLRLPFLHEYYYQTLAHEERDAPTNQ